MHWIKREKMDKKRHERLMRKIQKARALSRIEEIFSQSSWSKRFKRVAKMRANA